MAIGCFQGLRIENRTSAKLITCDYDRGFPSRGHGNDVTLDLTDQIPTPYLHLYRTSYVVTTSTPTDRQWTLGHGPSESEMHHVPRDLGQGVEAPLPIAEMHPCS